MKYYIPLIGFFIFLKEGSNNTLSKTDALLVFPIQLVSFVGSSIGLVHLIYN